MQKLLKPRRKKLLTKYNPKVKRNHGVPVVPFYFIIFRYSEGLMPVSWRNCREKW